MSSNNRNCIQKWLGGPPWVINILLSETCERFSWYGLRSILTLYCVERLKWAENSAISLFLYSSGMAYSMALIGGYVADTYWGKYKTIIRFSILYCVGSLLLSLTSIFSSVGGCLLALFIIAIGTGGIKPNVSSFGADQYHQDDKQDITRYFMAFYFCINTGSVASYIITPLLKRYFDYFVAFLVPCILLLLATYLFWRARKEYVNTPLSGSPISRVMRTIATARAVSAGTLPRQEQVEYGNDVDFGEVHWLTCAAGHPGCDRDAIVEAIAVARIGVVFTCLPSFWMLYDQQGSAWTLQANKMDGHGILEPEQMGIVNPVLVLAMIPLFNNWIYPLVSKGGMYKISSLAKMRVGMFVAAAAFLISAFVQYIIDSSEAPNSVSILWQLPQYVVLSVSEILVSIAGLEFAYENAPETMKSTIMSLFLLTTAVGDFAGGFLYNVLKNIDPTMIYLIFAGLMVLNAVAFARLSKTFVPYVPNAGNGGSLLENDSASHMSSADGKTPLLIPNSNTAATDANGSILFS